MLRRPDLWAGLALLAACGPDTDQVSGLRVTAEIPMVRMFRVVPE